MNVTEIRKLFESKYSTESWKSLLHQIFPDQALNKKPIEKRQTDLKKHEDAKSILELGIFDVSFDGTRKTKVAIYEVQLNKGKSVTRNRVGLRNILQHEVVPGDVDAVLASYYSEGSRDWRLTLISKSISWDHENNKVEWETQSKRYTYVLGETETVTTATSRFDWLLKQRDGSAWLLDIIKAFSVERISSEFFKGYHHLFEKFEEYLVDQTAYFNYFKKFTKEGTEKEKKEEAERLVRNFIKKLFGRIVFLYFLQKKGWLGVPKDKAWGEGERNFMRDLHEKFGKDPKFYEKVLAVLFFETLNTERKDELFSITKTKVPFLNGGLFDKDDIEPIEVKFPKALFQELFDFFDQYNFTIDENSPEDQDIGIDPEMLGLIFENLLEDNREKGTFYTPKEVVHYMCKESLSAYLKTTLKDKATEKELHQIEAFVKFNDLGTPAEVKKYAADIDHALRTVKICDPAIGSGAFPMGMVYEILRVKKEIFGYLRKNKFDYREEKLAIIKHSIYGIDLDKGAVDIARLRFWLSLIVDEEIPSPLPNLDYRIMQGDSLVESFEGIRLDYNPERNSLYKVTIHDAQTNLFNTNLKDGQTQVVYTGEQKASLEKLVEEYFEPHDYKTKRKIHDQIEKIIHDNIELIFKKEDEGIENKILIAEANKEKVRFDKNDSTAKRKQKEQAIATQEAIIERFEKERKELKQKLKRLDEISQKEEKPYFLWHIFFHEIFGKKKEKEIGFDIVIANPPYGVDVDKDIQEHYGLGKRDSYGVFMSMALKKLLKPEGHLCYIVSDTWLTISTHFELRQQILDHHHLQKVIRLHGDCFKATVNSCIVTVQTTASDKKHNSSAVKVLAADLTNLSTRKNIAEFRDKLFHLEEYVNTSTSEFAVYEYPQALLEISSNQPVIVGSPSLFKLLDESSCEKEKQVIGENESKREIEIRKVKIDDTIIELVRFGDIAEVNQGISTGQNEHYVRRFDDGEGYEKLDAKALLSENEISSLSDSEKLNGVNPKKYSGRKFIPFDKGGESDTDDGWLPNYFVAPKYFIDWSTKSLARMRTLTIAARKIEEGKRNEIKKDDEFKLAAALRNQDKWFKSCITFSPTGQYSPTFRLGFGTISQNTSSTIVIDEDLEHFAIGVLCSKFYRYLFKNYYNHTVHTQEGDVMNIIFPKEKNENIDQLAIEIVAKQKSNPSYSYLQAEQRDIDNTVYNIFKLSDQDINEVETWFARRYPKLAKYAYIKPKEELVKEEKKKVSAAERIKNLIAQGESKTLEFKSSLRFDMEKKGVPFKTIEHSTFKNIAAFLNSEGGTLLIGVNDESILVGLEETDFTTFGGKNKKDEFLKHMDNLVQEYFGNDFTRKFNIDFVEIDGKTICAIEIKERAAKPVPLNNKEKGREEFYVRRFASAKDLTLFESLNYIQEHWK